jgi:hypothetical protein
MGDPLDLPPGNIYIPILTDGEVGASNPAVVPSSDKDDFSARNVTLYSLVGLFFVTATGTGALLYDSHPWFGGFAALFGVAGLGITIILLIRYRPKTFHALIVAIAAFIATLVFLSYVTVTRPTAEDLRIEKQRADDVEAQLETARTAAAAAYVNPLHDNGTKWKVTQGLRLWSFRSTAADPHSPDCQISIIRYPETYTEVYAADFKEIMDVGGWKYTEHIADGTLPKGISFRGLKSRPLTTRSDPSEECTAVLFNRIYADGRTRSGSHMNNDFKLLTPAEASDFLNHCSPGVGCVEVNFGNEDTTQ